MRRRSLIAMILAIFSVAIFMAGCGGGGGGSAAVGGGGTTGTGRITVRSNLPSTGFTLDGVAYVTNTAGEDAIFPTATAKPYAFGCTEKDGYKLVVSPTSATLASGETVLFTCTFTAVVPTQTGTITITTSQSGINFSLSGASTYSGAIPASGGGYSYTISNAPAGSYNFSCNTALVGIGVTPNTSSFTLANGGSQQVACNVSPIVPPTNTSTITLYANKAQTSASTITCGTQSFTGRVTTDGGVVTVTNSAPAGTSCSAICSAITGQTVTNPPNQTTTAGGSLQFICNYTPTVVPPVDPPPAQRVNVYAEMGTGGGGGNMTINSLAVNYTFFLCEGCTFDLSVMSPAPTASTYTLMSCPVGYTKSISTGVTLSAGASYTFRCNYTGGGGGAAVCGDGFCAPTENASTCAVDCNIVWPPIE